ncbi:L,D-transpeptidase family protein [Pseudofulvibacter geojedonensis]|uniref:Murein L,D-transpeptidase n=1 Tax=Pseudofulvibacter geojedonensis TaxID=1123758 RepID=A0ABW3I0Q1_9FLAO
MQETLTKLALDSLNEKFNLKHKDSILAFYKLRNGKAAWGNINNRVTLLNIIKESVLEGLTPSDYNVKQIEKVVTDSGADEKVNIISDLFLTDMYLEYAYHLGNGKISPKSLYNDWELTPNLFSYNEQLNISLNENNINQSLDQIKPKEALYKLLKKQLIIAKESIFKDSLKTKIEHGDKIRPNKSDKRVISIRKRLNELGFLNDSLVNKSELLDTLLQESIESFQKHKQLKTDAIIGKGTVNALNKSYKDEYYSILANLERFRWFPRNKGKEYIIVNVADYNLTYVSPKDTTIHKVIVGRTDRKTPIFSSQINYLEFNPKWFIPPTIKNEDIIPAARKNSEYISNKNITVYNEKGNKVHPDSVNWNSAIVSNYRYVQSSGSSNALGRVKIIFPNKFSVYLHDTPSKSLFKKNYRARSSGCVRVENPFDLSAKLLREKEKYSRALIDTVIKKRHTLRVHLDKKVMAHFLYWTVIFNDNEQPIYINDVYNLDNQLAMKLLAN